MFLRPKAAKAGLIILAVVLAILLVGPFVVKFGPYQTTSALNQAPTLQHPFGTDYRGRDVYSQIIYGAFETLHVSFLAALGAVLLGTVVGVFSGYFGKLSGILTAANETILAFPAVPFLILLLLLFGANDVFVISVLILVLWAPISRALRPQVMSLKGLPYIDAAKMSGMSDVRIVFRTIIPSIAPISLAYFILQSATAVIITTGLQFLGIGNVNIVSWGSVLYWAQQYAFYNHDWWWILAPGIFISLLAISFALIGFALEEVFNPRLRSGL